jgi:uncharacterized protein YndB with AHSA1/START domain
MKRFTVTTELPVPPKTVYDAWLDSEAHSGMTQSPATASNEIAGIFTAHDGYINGINLELEDGRRILQTWRTDQFEDTDPDSSVEIEYRLAPYSRSITGMFQMIKPRGTSRVGKISISTQCWNIFPTTDKSHLLVR